VRRVTRVAVIGGGVIGLCVAQSLVRRGAEVVVLERDACGGAASAGNAGWITPSLSGPIPAPGVVGKAAKWMLDRESPLLIRPRLDPSFLGWLVSFWRACRRERYAAGMEATLRLAETTLDAFDRLVADGVEFEMHADGLLYLVRSEQSLQEWVEMYDDLEALGFDGQPQLLDERAVHALEPAINGGVAGGLLGRRERHVRPETLTRGLCRWLREHGAEMREHTRVEWLVRSGTTWTISTSTGAVQADRVVLAAGVWTKDLLRGLGVKIPLEGAKGYSVTAGVNGHVAPKRPLYLTEIKVGASPFDGAVRLAGTLELSGRDLRVDERRVAAMVGHALEYLGGWAPDHHRVDWAGLRPLLPDAIPLVGEVPGHRGAYAATGHGMLGVTLAPATGEALAQLMLEDERPAALAGVGFERL
jgi:D-amino-acid dehydrogenase